MRLIVLYCILILSGCASAGRRSGVPIRNDIALTHVARSDGAEQRWGPLVQSHTDSAGRTRYYAKDSLVNLGVYATDTHLQLLVHNLSAETVRLLWDGAVFVDHLGQSQKVIHDGVKYADRAASHPPAVIPRGGALRDAVGPIDRISFDEGVYGMFSSRKAAWVTGPLLPPDAVAGQTMRLILPLDVAGVVTEYDLTFTLQGAGVRP